MQRPSSRRSQFLVAALLGAAALAACSDGQPVAPAALQPPPQPAADVIQVYECTGSTSGALGCKAGGSIGQALGRIIGGQNLNVRLTSSNVSYNPATEIFKFDVTVQNQTDAAMGTPGGSPLVPDPEGIQVFFHMLPTATSGTGTITVANADGIGTFTSTNQPFYAYHQILLEDAVSSAKTWRFHIPSTVSTFKFILFIETDVEYLLVATELMANPGGAILDTDGEWVELCNGNSLNVNLKDLVIADSAPSGPRQYHRISASVPVPAKSCVVLGRTTNTTLNGGVPVNYAYGSALLFRNAGDQFFIGRVFGNDTLLVDYIKYATVSSSKDGISRELTSFSADNTDVDGIHWADASASTVYGPGGRGTPGAGNFNP